MVRVPRTLGVDQNDKYADSKTLPAMVRVPRTKGFGLKNGSWDTNHGRGFIELNTDTKNIAN